MWQFQIKNIKSERVDKITIFSEEKQITYAEVIKLWQGDDRFCSFFNSLLANSKFSAYFWETPPITKSNINIPFEFVLVNNPRMQNLQPNARTFKKYFTTASKKQPIVTFPNLRGYATLIAPCPLIEDSAYTHIANFVRQAPSSQTMALWQTLGTVVEQELNHKPLWVSTSGLGVYWLHIRLDSVPKYYTFQPYKEVVTIN